MISRRTLLGLAGLGLGAWALPAWAGPSASGRRFIFVFADGGWDTTRVFSPMFDNPNVDMETDVATAEVSGIRFVDSGDRPQVRAFFEDHGHMACVLNGIQMKSVAHTACKRQIMTGSLHQGPVDWATRLGSRTGDGLHMPLVAFSGPLYSEELNGAVVRVGEERQLAGLLDGQATLDATIPMDPVRADLAALQDDALATLLAARTPGTGREADHLAQAIAAESRGRAMIGMADQLDMGSAQTLPDKLLLMGELFERDLAACGIVQHNGSLNLSWDTHGDNARQGPSFEQLFESLNILVEDLSSRPGSSGSLMDDTTVVVFSEMGRFPLLNAHGGKEHWVWTSAMLFGAGVAGGQVIGHYNEGFTGDSVDLDSGGLDNSGVTLTPEHLGATLFALADIDPAEHVSADPIRAALL